MSKTKEPRSGFFGFYDSVVNRFVGVFEKRIDFSKYEQYLEEFNEALTAFKDDLKKRKSIPDMRYSDDPFGYLSDVFNSADYYLAINRFYIAEKEYDKNNGRVSRYLWIVILVTIAAFLTPSFVLKNWLVGVPFLLVGIFLIFAANDALNVVKGNVTAPKRLFEKFRKLILIGPGWVSKTEYAANARTNIYENNRTASKSRQKQALRRMKNQKSDSLSSGVGDVLLSSLDGSRVRDSLPGLWKTALKVNDTQYVAGFLKYSGIAGEAKRLEVEDSLTTYDGNHWGRAVTCRASHTEYYKDKDGKTQSKEVTDFNGTLFISPINLQGILQEGERLLISKQGGYLSYLLEDTVRNIYKNKKEFVFETERLNQNLNCILDTDLRDHTDIQMRLQKLVTPVFEQFLEFLLDRFGQYTLLLTEQGMTLATYVGSRAEDSKDVKKALLSSVTGGLSNVAFKLKEGSLVRDYFYDIVPEGSFREKYSPFQYWNLFPMIEAGYLTSRLPLIVYRTLADSGDKVDMDITIEDVQGYDITYETFEAFHTNLLDFVSMKQKEMKQEINAQFGELKEQVEVGYAPVES